MRNHAKYAAILLAAGLLLQFNPLHSAADDAPKRPRITGIDHVRLYVADSKRSSEFYSRFLSSYTKPAYGCRGVEVPCFPVYLTQEVELEQVRALPPANWLAEVSYSTDNVEQMRRYLATNGIPVTPITKDPNGARRFELRDPEGNRLSFIQRAEHFFDFFGPGGRVGEHLIHAGFVVKDMAAENKFYRDLLGFKLYWHGGFKDDGLDWYEIQVPDGSDWIEYMLNIPANADHKELGVQNHFSLGVKDIHAAAEQLRKNGLLKFDGPEIGRDGKWGLDAYDPDGTRVEFMEPTPAREPCCHAYTAPHPQL